MKIVFPVMSILALLLAGLGVILRYPLTMTASITFALVDLTSAVREKLT